MTSCRSGLLYLAVGYGAILILLAFLVGSLWERVRKFEQARDEKLAP